MKTKQIQQDIVSFVNFSGKKRKKKEIAKKIDYKYFELYSDLEMIWFNEYPKELDQSKKFHTFLEFLFLIGMSRCVRRMDAYSRKKDLNLHSYRRIGKKKIKNFLSGQSNKIKISTIKDFHTFIMIWLYLGIGNKISRIEKTYKKITGNSAKILLPVPQ